MRLLLALLFLLPPAALAAESAPPVVKVEAARNRLPLVTLSASEVPLRDVAALLAKELAVPVNVTETAKPYRVTTKLHRQPLDLALREIAPQAYIDGVLRGGSEAAIETLAIHLSMANDPPPSLEKLKQRSSDVVMFFGHTEDPGADPLEGKLDVTYRDDRLRVFAKKQQLSVIAFRVAEAVGIPLELVGDTPEIIDVSVADATLEQVMAALTPSARLYYRVDLSTLRLTPVRMSVHAPSAPPASSAPEIKQP